MNRIVYVLIVMYEMNLGPNHFDCLLINCQLIWIWCRRGQRDWTSACFIFSLIFVVVVNFFKSWFSLETMSKYWLCPMTWTFHIRKINNNYFSRKCTSLNHSVEKVSTYFKNMKWGFPSAEIQCLVDHMIAFDCELTIYNLMLSCFFFPS